ncbi:MAG: PilW family protein [Pseudomonadota bacterium]|nr:PilW family protein [Pseudomonadota bacterium]
MKSQLRCALRAHAGFSLIEMMIGLTVGLVLLTVLATVFERTSGGRTELDRMSRLVENSRFAVDVIGDDVRHAGFYGTFLPPSDAVFTNTSPCAWNVADIASLGWQPAQLAPSFPAQLMGWDDPAANDAALNCLPNRVPGTDVIVIRRVSADPVAVAQIDPANIYVQASACISDTSFLRVSNLASQFTLRTASCNAALLSPIRRYFVRGYYLAACNNCLPSDGIPTLKRVEIFGNNVAVVSLAEGVLDMQVEYAFDTNDDGSPETFLTSTTPDTTPTSRWSNVVAMRLHLLMRSNDAGSTAMTSPGVYDLGPGHAGATCPAGFKCRLVTTTMRLNNIAGRRES